jgi:O-antigen/teichoic acid export membrane protein
MQQFSRIVARNSAFSMVAQLLIKILSFGFTVLIVRQLGEEAYGQYAGVLAFGAVFVFLADLGLGTFSVREVARWRDTPTGLARAHALYGNLLALRFGLSLLAAVCIIGSAWLTGKPLVFVGAVALGTLGLLIYSAQGTSEAMLNGFERLDLAAGAKVANQLVFVCVGAGALWLGLGYYGLIYANLLGVVLMTYVCWRGVRHLGLRPTRPTPQQWQSLLRLSIPFGIIGFTLGLSYKFDSVLLTIFRSDAETGYYNAAYNLIFSAVIFSNVLNTSLYPSITRQAASAPERLPAIYERALRYLLIVALPIAVLVWALADQLVLFLFKERYLLAAPALQILIWVVPFMYVSEFLGYVVLIAGHERLVARSVLISTSFNIALNLLLVPVYGFMAAAVMTVLTEVVLVIQYVWIMRAMLHELSWGKTLWRPLIAVLFAGLVAWLLRPYAHFIITGLVSAGVYGLGLFTLGVIGKDEWHFVCRLRSSPLGDTPSDAPVTP